MPVGARDGTPPLATREQRERWHRVCERVFLGLRARAERGEPTFLDDYGATNEAESRCALLLGRLRPDLQIGVATGLAKTTGRVPVGAAIDRAAGLIAGARASRTDVAIDELTLAGTLGQARSTDDLEAWLGDLVQREMFEPCEESRLPREREYKFRHGLLREAAYGMLTDVDRVTGHALAGDWLERAGEKDAMMLADHFERGGEHVRAIPWLLQAAHIQIDGGNLDAGVLLAARGIACGAEGVERGILRLAQAQARCWRGAFPKAIEAGHEAMALLPVGSTRWFAAASSVLWAATFVGDQEGTAGALQAVSSVSTAPEPSGPYGHSLFWVSQILLYVGQIEDAQTLVRRAEANDTSRRKRSCRAWQSRRAWCARATTASASRRSPRHCRWEPSRRRGRGGTSRARGSLATRARATWRCRR